MSREPATIKTSGLHQSSLFLPATAAPGFLLTQDDIGIVQSVFNYRLLHIDHLSALKQRSYKKIHGRVLKLVHKRFLAASSRRSKSTSTSWDARGSTLWWSRG